MKIKCQELLHQIFPNDVRSDPFERGTIQQQPRVLQPGPCQTLTLSAGVFQIVTIITALINITETLTGIPAADRGTVPENVTAHFKVEFSISEST